MTMKTYLDSDSAKTVLTAVRTYTNNKVDSLPEATTTSAGLLSPADKQKLQDTRFLGTFTILASDWDADRLSQVVSVPGAHSNRCTVMITPKTRADANFWIDFGIYYDDTYQEQDYMKFTCVEIPDVDVRINISSITSGAFNG